MSVVNQVTLIGEVVSEPEFRMTKNGKKMATFYLSTDRQWQDRQTGENKVSSERHRIVTFEDANTIEQTVKRGSKLVLRGSIQYRKYTSSSGESKYITEIVLIRSGDLQVIDGKSSNNNYQSSFNKTERKLSNTEHNEDAFNGDLPEEFFD